MNVVKHAEVDKACICLAWADRSTLSITVSDQGRGFDTRGQHPQAHFCLFSIRERIEAFGGSLQVTSSLGKGTRATICMPALHGSLEDARRVSVAKPRVCMTKKPVPRNGRPPLKAPSRR